MKRIVLAIGLVLCTSLTFAQDAYKLYTKDGKEVKFDNMIKDLAKSDVVLFGEQHNNPIGHWMQLRVTKGVYALQQNLILGAEMFESDNQLLINEYFNGQIRGKDFEKEARLWDNYKTDYKPLLEFARTNQLPFIATNVPRRYAAMVNRGGFEVLDSLSDAAKEFIAPLKFPYDTANPSVQKMLTMDFGHGMGGAMAHSMAKAQCVKDATMAHFIIQNWKKKSTFIHYQGDFHSAHYGGIYWYLKYWEPKIDVKTISTIEGEGDLSFKEEYGERADYILVVTKDMTKTY